MSTTTIFIFIIVIAAVIAVVGIIAVARGRSDSDGAETAAELDRKAVKADKARRKALAAATVSTASTSAPPVTMVEPAEEYTDDAPRVEVSATELGVTRRKFFNRALTAVFGLFMLQFALAGLAFFWPKLKGGFGTPIKVGEVGALKSEVLVAGAIVPKFVPAAQAWIVPFEMSSLEGSSFEETPFVVAGGEGDGIGLMALWQRCVHLGCRVPSCESSQGFECPCHGSKYNGHGEYAAGPAPRNLDRFAVSVDSGGVFVVDTGTVVRTARAKTYTVDYPQGPFCVG